MAKQTFTTGQVLTAAQMTSLQQTAMLGGAASAKTASYTLVAADAGSAISMSNASATTITVNTALFAAGDTVHITNLGAGVCTITAGTATVNSSASLALAQYESGFLDFTSTSAAIFVKGAGAAAGGGANWTLLNSGGTSLSGSSTTVSGISGKNGILVLITDAVSAAYGLTKVRLNGDTGSNYAQAAAVIKYTTTNNIDNVNPESGLTQNSINLGQMSTNATSYFSGSITFDGCNSSGVKTYIANGCGSGVSGAQENKAYISQGYYNSASTISSITVLTDTGTFSAGTVYVYTSA